MIILQYLIDALSIGGLYALAALGIGLIFGIMRLINFAYGDLLMMGAYAMFMMAAAVWPITILGGVVVAILVALITERIAFRPLRTADPSVLLAASFAVSFFLQNFVLMIMGGRALGVDIVPALSLHLNWGEISVSLLNLFTIALSLILMIGLSLFLNRTQMGVNMRAASEDVRMARMMGVRVNLVIATAFAISGLLAGAAAIVVLGKTGLVLPAMGLRLTLVAFVATVVGGMGSLTGAVIGGYAVGILEVVLGGLLPLALLPYREAFIFTVVLLFLMYRPGGIIKVATLEERV
ncbi:MAG: branched-chain amino acid ABC transporter permease [Alphaproteobacteria bacterium]|nr:branched-chain amino acid ABC transporter permease [Alphaproteobacteria bacterium]MDP6816888.1 branched-chain amino acid ABC transporter permease [Alphaproteobacteria bacterium]